MPGVNRSGQRTRWWSVSAGALLALTGPWFVGGCLMQAIYGNPPDRVVMEPEVHALAGLNTPFDEFNAVAIPPPLKLDTLLVFASNSATQGRRFEIETARLQLLQAPYSQRADGNAPAPRISAERTGRFAGIPASGGNQLGPTPLSDTRVSGRIYDEPFPPHMTMSLDLEREPLPWSGAGKLSDDGVWMFDSDRAGRRNLYFVDPQGQKQAFFGNRADADDAYASYDFERHVLYFSSNRSGRYRIYRYKNSDGNTRFASWLGDPARAAAIEPVPALNAEGNTLAPFVQGDLLLFASDRPGGFGGYDLYLARHGPQGWERPANIQEFMPADVRVNTAANEFRPSLLTLGLRHAADLNVLLFSSDRPGGQGGYDLYLTALPEAR